MPRGDFPSSKQDQYMVRFPDGMREQLKSAAAEAGRSMNAEIVHRLQQTIDRDASDAAYFASRPPSFSDDQIDAMARQYEEMLGAEVIVPDSDQDSSLSAFESEIFSELSQVVMKMAKRLSEAKKAEPPMTPEDFYEYSLAQIQDMPEEERAGAIGQLDQTMEKAAKRFGFSWPRDKSGVPF